MIAYLDPWLDRWAAWSRSGKERLGFASQSPIYKMMTTNAATTSGARYRGKRHLLITGEGAGVRLVVRNIDPMRCTEPSGKRIHGAIPDDPACEMMEEAITQLRDERYKKAINLKYCHRFDDQMSARDMGVSKATFKILVNLARESLDTYMRARHEDKHRQIAGDFEFVLKIRGK